jgi:mycofactocin system glycosyltransferase
MTYPLGVRIELDADTKQLADDVLFGGSPARALRLGGAGVRALAELQAGPVATAAGATLARRLTDGGLAHPCPSPASLEATVVVPVYNRAVELDRCLAAAGHDHPVLVVDDGSTDPEAVAAVCARHGAELVRRPVNGGAGAARNTALAHVDTEFVAFLDSDCVASLGWITALGGHFADPRVAAVAPRVTETGTGPSPLDLGDRPGRVAPLTRVAYIPTAALIVRRAALADGFDESLRHGEDVDLVWRLVEDGWRIRYDPSVRIAHTRPPTGPGRLRRRFVYGTTAAPLTRRHPGAVAPLVLQPWPTLVVGAVLARRPITALAAFTVSTARLRNRLREHDLPTTGLVRANAGGVLQTGLGIGRWFGQFAAPALLAAGRRSPWRAGMAVALLAGPPLADWIRQRPPTGPARFVAAGLAEQAAYGAGVWVGCLRERRFAALRPSVRNVPRVQGRQRPVDLVFGVDQVDR